MSLLTDQDIYFFEEGTHLRLADSLGAHSVGEGSRRGTNFAVWAPGARYVSVFGDFNGWDKHAAPLTSRGHAGLWETFVPNVDHGARYKYYIESDDGRYKVDNADPLGFLHDQPPDNASVVCSLEYQ